MDWCERALTIEGLWVTLVVVHPVLAVGDFIEIPAGGQQSLVTQPRHLRKFRFLFLVLPHVDNSVSANLGNHSKL